MGSLHRQPLVTAYKHPPLIDYCACVRPRRIDFKSYIIRLTMLDFPRLPPSGIHVAIVGAGFSGLAAAIECDRKGHSVTPLKKCSCLYEISSIGDIISFDPNGSCAFEWWPGVVDAMVPACIKRDYWDLHYWQTGEVVSWPSFANEREWGRRLSGHRAEMHRIIYDHAVARGLDIRLGKRATDYFETDENAGMMVDGQQMTANLVITAKGVRSRGRKIVLGFEDPPRSSGYAAYRAWFDGTAISNNLKTKHLLAEGDTPRMDREERPFHHTWA